MIEFNINSNDHLICRKCHQKKLIEGFSIYCIKKKDYICILCNKKVKAVRYKNNKQYYLDKNKRYYWKYRDYVRDYRKECYAKNIRNEEYYIKKLIERSKKRAKDKKIAFNLKPEDVVIPELCPVLGIKLVRNFKQRLDDSISIDRIDNNKGYTKENIAIISDRANRLKNNATKEEIKLLYQWMEKVL